MHSCVNIRNQSGNTCHYAKIAANIKGIIDIVMMHLYHF